MRVVVRLILRVLFAAAFVGAPVVLAQPASALSCAGPESILGPTARFPSDTVFRGKIVDAIAGELVVEVSEVWKGGPVDSKVRLQVDLPGWSSWSDKNGDIVDGYRDDRDWLFAPTSEGNIPEVNPCSAWETDGSLDVLRFRPAQVTEPRAVTVAAPARENADRDAAGLLPVVVGIGAAVVLVPALAVVVVQRRVRRPAGT